MKKAFSHSVLFFALLFSVFLPGTGAIDDDAKWTRIDSQNFILIGDASEKEIRRVATKLEQFREFFKTLFPRMVFTSPVQTKVIVFRSEKRFRPYKPVDATGKTTGWIAGYFQPGEDTNYIVLSTEGETQQTYTTIFHEYVHLLVNNSFGRSRIPPWFNEGIAEYYDQFAIEDDQRVKLGGLNGSHLDTLQRTKLIPFETFFNIDYPTLHQQGGHSANIFYAQSWALMHYLLHGNNGARRDKVGIFLNEMSSGKAARPSFEKAFGTDFATMEKELKKYVEQRLFNVLIVTLDRKLTFENSLRSAPLPTHEAKATLGDLLAVKGRLDEADAHLRDALAGDPASAEANATLGIVRMRQKRFPEAKQLLEKAVASDSRNHLVHYRYAYVLSRESFGEGNFVSNFADDVAAKMRAALRRSIELNPNFPESYGLLAFISLVRNDEIDESIGYVEKALKLAPGDEDYILHLAGLHMRRSDFDKAQTLAEGVRRSAVEPDARVRAEWVLRNISSMREYADANKRAGSDPGSPPRLTRTVIVDDDKPPTEEEIARLRAQAQLEGINEALRKPGEGEKRILGNLSKIECGRAGVIYTVRHGSEVMKLRSTDFQGLELMSFVPEFQNEIGCQGLPKEIFAVLTFAAGDDAKSKTAGRLVAIEVVPADFRFLEK